MLITAQLFGDFKKYENDPIKKRWVGNLTEGATIENLIDQIGLSKDKVFLILVNDCLANRDTILADRDEVVFLTLLGGG